MQFSIVSFDILGVETETEVKAFVFLDTYICNPCLSHCSMLPV